LLRWRCLIGDICICLGCTSSIDMHDLIHTSRPGVTVTRRVLTDYDSDDDRLDQL